jgi:hypothetical protein
MSLLILAGTVFQLIVVLLFYSNMYPHIQRLLPDDTFYYLTIARNISAGMGSVFSPGEPTNGYHPLWMGVLTTAGFIIKPDRGQFIFIALLLSVVFNAMTARALGGLLGHMGFSSDLKALGSGLYMVLPWLVLLNLSGMETPLFFLCLVFFFTMLLRTLDHSDSGKGRHILLGVSAGLLFLSRTDSIFFILAGAAVLTAGTKAGAGRAGLLLAGVVSGLIALPWVAWCTVRFGSPVQTSGYALAHLRWHTMYPVTSFKYWIYNGGRLFHKLAVLLVSPLSYRYGDFDTILPLWADVLVFVLMACAVFWLIKHKKRVAFPAFIWLPSLLILLFYTFVRLASAVWHLSVFALLLLLMILNAARVHGLGRRFRAILLTGCLLLNIYTLGNGFYYPQQATDIMGAAISLGQDHPGTLRIGSTDAGYLGYFSGHEVVNLDGVVNHRAYLHIREGTLGTYISGLGLDIVMIQEEARDFYTRNDP